MEETIDPTETIQPTIAAPASPMDSRSMRREAWRLLFKEKFFARLVGLTIFFYIVNFAYSSLIQFATRGTATGALFEKIQNAKVVEDLVDTVQHFDSWGSFLALVVFNLFMTLVLQGIFLESQAYATLRAADGARDIKGALGAFSRPFGNLFLVVAKAISTWWPVLVYILICGFFAGLGRGLSSIGVGFGALCVTCASLPLVYRYRMAWFFKALAPESTARECLAKSAQAMAGAKWRNFLFDCSYWKIFTVMIFLNLALAILGTLPVAAGAVPAALAQALTVVVMVVFALLVFVYVQVGQAVFFRTLVPMRQDAMEAE